MKNFVSWFLVVVLHSSFVLRTCWAYSMRTHWTKSAAVAVTVLLQPSLGLQSPDSFAAVFAAEAPQNVLVWKTGKNPVVVDPNDPKKGSKKDYTFLKCLSGCKQDCQKPGEGAARGDCVQDCQDQCCSTYEQCTFRVKTSSNEI